VDNDAIYRNYNNDFLKVEESASLIVYSTITTGFRGQRIITHYFSKTLSSSILTLNMNNLLVQYKDNPCFIEKLGQQLANPYDCSVRDYKSSSFLIAEILKQCN
jgi:hypothetical protein